MPAPPGVGKEAFQGERPWRACLLSEEREADRGGGVSEARRERRAGAEMHAGSHSKSGQKAEVRRRRATGTVARAAVAVKALVDVSPAFEKDAEPAQDEDVPLRRDGEHQVVRAALIRGIAIDVVHDVTAEAHGEVVWHVAQGAADEGDGQTQPASKA